jgi:hypothetical protein
MLANRAVPCLDRRVRSAGVAVVLVAAVCLIAPAGASALSCYEKLPPATADNSYLSLSGLEGAKKSPLGLPFYVEFGSRGMYDPGSVVFEIRREEDGATIHVRPTQRQGDMAFRFAPRQPGSYAFHVSFDSYECSGGTPFAPTEAQSRGPGSAPDATRIVVVGDPPKVDFRGVLLPKGYLAGIPFGSARLSAIAHCNYETSTVKPLTSILHYTTDGRRPTVDSPTLRATAQKGCWGGDSQFRSARGAWGRVVVSAAKGGVTFVTVTPGRVVRVWFEVRIGARVVAATRARSRERNGLQRWVPDAGSCPGASGGCARIRAVVSPAE